MSNIKYKNVKDIKIKKENDRDCFLYGLCSKKDISVPECHKITQFGLDALNAEGENLTDGKGEIIDTKEDEKNTQDLNVKERACAIHGRCAEDPFNDLLHDLSKFGLKVVKE